MGVCTNKILKHRNSQGTIYPFQQPHFHLVNSKSSTEKTEYKSSYKQDLASPIEPQQVDNTENKNKNTNVSRTGIYNVGWTSYMSATLQALLSVYKDEYLANSKGKLGIQLKKIFIAIRQNNISVRPTEFKDEFDKHFKSFKEQRQFDAVLFCRYLLFQFKQENQQLVQKLLQIKIRNINKCTKCSQKQQTLLYSLFLDVPLKKQVNKQVKVDYIIKNTTVQTVAFQMEEQNKMLDWKKSFQKVSNAKDYFLCQIQNSDIINIIDNLNNLKNQTVKSFGIYNLLTLTAYETVVVKSKLQLQKTNDYRTYTDDNGNKNLAMLLREQPNTNQVNPSSNRNSDQNQSKQPFQTIKVIILSGNHFEEKLVLPTQLSNFPQNYPPREIYIKVINYNEKENKKIGRPFIFKVLQHYPISTIREALQKCIGTEGYYLRLSPLSQLTKCCVCNQLNQKTSQCLREKENSWPICWVKNQIQFLVVWQETSQYRERISYKKQESVKSNKMQQCNSFNLNAIQSIQLHQFNQCIHCLHKKVKMEHQQLVCRWPDVLILHLMRFVLRNGQFKKISTKWKIQQILTIKNDKFVLTSVICHSGQNILNGHYSAVTSGTKYDDESLSSMAYSQIPPQDIYMLFYVKITK